MSLRMSLAALAAVATLAFAGTPSLRALQTPPPAGLATAATEFDVNGLKVIVKRRTGSATVAGGLFLRGGTRNITDKNAGIEALMLDVASEASTTLPRDQFRRELARTGTVIGSGVNLDYSALTLACTRRYFDQAWTLFADAAIHPRFAPDDFDRVKSQQLVGLANRQDAPDTLLQKLQAQVVYAGHPYANDPHGTPATLASLTVDDVRKYHAQMMQTSRLLLVLVGDLDPAQVQQKVQASFGALPRGRYAPAPVPPLWFGAPTVHVTAKALPTHYVQGVYAAPALTSTDIYPMRVATSILSDRVFEEVRSKRALSYAPDAFLWNQSANLGGIYVTAENVTEAVRVMQAEIVRLRTTEVDADTINATVQQFLTEYYVGQETNAAQAGTLAQTELLGGGWRTAGDNLTRLRGVTPQDVRRVSDLYMRNLQFVVLGDAKDVDTRVFLQQYALLQPPAAALATFARR